MTDTGGHVGFVSGKLPRRPQYWLEERVPEFLKNIWINLAGRRPVACPRISRVTEIFKILVLSLKI